MRRGDAGTQGGVTVILEVFANEIQDANMRLLTFRTIVEMDQTGELEEIFNPSIEASSSSMMQLSPGIGLYIVIMIGVVLLAGV